MRFPPGLCPGPRWGAYSAPLPPSWKRLGHTPTRPSILPYLGYYARKKVGFFGGGHCYNTLETIPSGSVSASVIPASAAPPAAEPSDVAGKLDSIMLRLEKLNVLDQLVVHVTNLTKSLEFCHESIAELKRENVELKTRVTELCRDNTEQQRAAKADHDALVDLTWRSMRDNLLFYSIPETTSDEDCDATVQKFFRDELGITEDIGLERLHRMGKRCDGKCRPIVAKFSSFKQREVVRLAGPKLAGKRFRISEQIPKEWQDRRKALLPAFKDAKRQGKRARFVGDKLLVEGQFVTPNTSQHA